MSPRHTPREIRWYDRGKYAVALLLLLAIVLLFLLSALRNMGDPRAAGNAPVTLVTPVPTYTVDAATLAAIRTLATQTAAEAEQADGEETPPDAEASPSDVVSTESATEAVSETDVVSETVAPADDAEDSSAAVEPAAVEPDVAVEPPTVALAAAEIAPGLTTLAGSSAPAAGVEVLIDGALLGQAVADDAGDWTLDANLRTPGEYALSARVDGVESEPATLTVIAAAEVTEEEATVPANVAVAEKELPASAIIVDDLAEELPVGTTTFSGISAPAVAVDVLIDGALLGQTVADDAGNWALDATLRTPGEYALSARTDGIESDPIAITVVAVEEELSAPVINAADLVDKLPVGATAFSGVSAPAAAVEVLIDDAPLGQTTADDEGNWSLDANLRSPGEYTLTARTNDIESDPVAITVVVGEEESPALALMPMLKPAYGAHEVGIVALEGEGEPGATLDIVVDGEAVDSVTVDDVGAWTYDLELTDPGAFRVAVRNMQAGASSGDLSPATTVIVVPAPAPMINADALAEELPVGATAFSGVSAPDAIVEVLIDGAPLGQTTADSEGNWSLDANLRSPGEYTLAARTDGAESDPIAITVIAIEEEMPAIAPALKPVYGAHEVGSVVLEGEGEPGATLDVIVDGETIDSVTVDDVGAWTYDLELTDPGAFRVAVRSAQVDDSPASVSEATTIVVVPAPVTDKAAEADIGETAGITDTNILTATASLTTTDVISAMGAITTAEVLTAVTPLTQTFVLTFAIPATASEPISASESLSETELSATDVVTASENAPTTILTLAIPMLAAQPITTTLPITAAEMLTGTGVLTATDAVTTNATVSPTTASIEAEEPESQPPTVDAIELASGGDTVELAGTGTPTEIIQVLVDARLVASTTIDADGAWSASAPLTDVADAADGREIQILSVAANGDIIPAATTSIAIHKLLFAALPEPTDTPTNTPEPTATATSTSTDTPEPTATSTDTPEPTPTNTDTPAPTATPTDTPEPTATDTPEPTATASATDTPVPTDTPTSTPTSTPTDTPAPTATNTSVPTDIPTATNTAEPTATLEPTSTPTASAGMGGATTETGVLPAIDLDALFATLPDLVVTPTDIPEPTATASSAPTNTPKPTATNTPVPTATPTATTTDTPEPTATATATSTDTPEPTDTPTATPTNTPEPTATATDTPTSTPTDAPEPTATNTSVPTDTPTVTATLTNTPEPTATLEPTSTPTASAGMGGATTETGVLPAIDLDALFATLPGLVVTPTATPEPTATPTNTLEPTATATATNTPTNTPEPTATPVPTETPTSTPTATPTATPEPTATATLRPTDTPTATSTNTPESTATATATATNAPEPTATPTNTPAPTNTPTATPEPTATATATATNTPEPTATAVDVITTDFLNAVGGAVVSAQATITAQLDRETAAASEITSTTGISMTSPVTAAETLTESVSITETGVMAPATGDDAAIVLSPPGLPDTGVSSGGVGLRSFGVALLLLLGLVSVESGKRLRRP